MKTFFTTIFFLSGFFLSSGQPLQLTYNEVIRIALDQNVLLNTQKNEMHVVKAEKARSFGEIAPSISASVNAFQANGNTFIEQEALLINTVSDNLRLGLDARMDIFRSFYRINDIKKAKTDLSAQQNIVIRTSQDVIFQASNDFLQILLDEELLRIAIDNHKTQQVLLTQIEAMVEAGTRPRSDLYDQQAVVKQMELLVVRARNNLSNDEAQLAITLQLDPRTDVSLVDPDWGIEEIMVINYELEELYNTALANRADLKQFRLEEQSWAYSKSMAKSNFMPVLGAYFAFSTRYNDQSSNSLNDQLWTNNKGHSYGLFLSIPIFSGLRHRSNYVRTIVRLENAGLNTDNLEKSILIDVRNAYQNYLDVKTGYEVTLAQLESAKVALEVQNEKYNLGVGNLIELTNANNNFVQAQANRAQAVVNLLFQKIILDYHTGQLAVPVAGNN
jgi:outer membrane protein